MNQDGMQVTEQDSTSEWKHRGDYERRGPGATLGWDVTGLGDQGCSHQFWAPVTEDWYPPGPHVAAGPIFPTLNNESLAAISNFKNPILNWPLTQW